MNLDAPVSTIMTTSIECVSPDQEIVEIKHIYEQPVFHSHIPVTENNKIVGIVSLIDFMRAIHDASLDDSEEVYHQLTVKDIMTANPSYVSPDTSIKDVVSILSKDNFHSILVVSDGAVKGIVTTTDILKKLIES